MSPPVMPRAERSERKAQVLKMKALGMTPQAIATRVGLPVKRVHGIISGDARSKGAFQKDNMHQMWVMDEDARRQEIIKRASHGARLTLEMSSSQ